jgi:hypothetical protein
VDWVAEALIVAESERVVSIMDEVSESSPVEDPEVVVSTSLLVVEST